MRLSVSKLKTFNASKAKFAGQYILGVKDDYSNDSQILGQMFEHWLFFGEDKMDLLATHEIEDTERFVLDYEALKYNSQGIDIEKGQLQYEVRGEVFGHEFIGYIDNLLPHSVDDIKTSRYTTSKDAKSKNSWSGMSYYEEYELQLWLYMKVLNRDYARIIEVPKHRYKDGEAKHQIIEFNRTPERDQEMTEKWRPKIDAMYELYYEYRPKDASNDMSSNT